ncbi:serine O-acetyltransferase [Fibrobacter sp. UWCM]|uniref:serine acetyltransferase n=1 Tax=Fibrobacter sp. UWCM TaxID=1896208 RepID=UPI00091DA2DC|nr:serine acetyltransferase [Fibrobacter sp. UWCM]SHH83513.1 serine O-acetyltransferase [Fibrobacter sp. UWCM]
MLVKKLFTLKYWCLNLKQFRDDYSYDLKFNASFRGKKELSKDDLKLPQIRYLKYYRKAQMAKGTFLSWYYMRKLVKFSYWTGILLYENMNFPKGLIIGHPGTIVVNSHVVFDGNIMITHGVTIGRDVRGRRAGTPKIGKNVCIRCNSTVVGGITIGDDVLIAPNTFVNFDVPSHSIVIGNPATIHHRDNATEGHIGKV